MADGLFCEPFRRRLSPDDDLFAAGDVSRASNCKLSVFVEEREGETTADLVGRKFICGINGCDFLIDSTQQYEAHYCTCHQFGCATCGHMLPTARLLDMHLSEVHDSFFCAMAERRPMYRCLVEGCDGVFKDPAGRRTHLIAKHGYSRSFDVGGLLERRRFSSQRRGKGKDAACEEKRPPPRRRRGAARERAPRDAMTAAWAAAVAAPGSAIGNVPPSDDAMEADVAGSTGSGAAVIVGDAPNFTAPAEPGGGPAEAYEMDEGPPPPQQQRRGEPCRYVGSRRGCVKGGCCSFLHEAPVPASGARGAGSGGRDNGGGEPARGGRKRHLRPKSAAEAQEGNLRREPAAQPSGGSEDMDEVTEAMSRLHVPKEIRFGRRR